MSNNNELTTTQLTQLKNKEAMLKALEKVNSVTAAAKAVGIGTKTHYRYMKQDPEYALVINEQMESLREQRIDQLEEGIMNQALGVWDNDNNKWTQAPNPISQIFALKALTRQSQHRTWSDAPPEPKQEQQDKALPLDATSGDKLRELMKVFVDTLPEAKPIEPTTIQTQENTKE